MAPTPENPQSWQEIRCPREICGMPYPQSHCIGGHAPHPPRDFIVTDQRPCQMIPFPFSQKPPPPCPRPVHFMKNGMGACA